MSESLAISPDLSAYYCYLVVLVVGLIAAYSRVSRLFENYPGALGTVNFWLLLIAYTVIPVLLFWFLDRTNAIHDTSIFAAILIAVGYRQVISGNIAGVRVSGEIGKVWQPFEAWANWVSDRIRARVQLKTERYTDQIITSLRQDPQKLERLKNLALLRSPDPQTVQADFDALDTADTRLLWGEEGITEKQIRYLYQTLKSIPDGFRLMQKGGIVTQWQHLWYARQWKSLSRTLILPVVLLAVIVGFRTQLFTSSNWARYYLWRLQKPNTTAQDQFRSREEYTKLLKASPDAEFARIEQLLRYQALPLDTADRLLAIAVESRGAPKTGIQSWLTSAMRAENPDVRARVQNALLYLADDQNVCVGESLRDWKPSKNDSATQIDQRIKDWQGYWNKGPSAAPCPEASKAMGPVKSPPSGKH
jgi:hypothetical protein